MCLGEYADVGEVDASETFVIELVVRRGCNAVDSRFDVTYRYILSLCGG
jgi:hypothetical protein